MADLLSITYIAQSIGLPLWTLYLVLVWSLFWKAVALWKSARLNQPVWFILMLVINTLGILEILYIFLFSEINLDKKDKSKKNLSSKNKKRK